MDDKILLALLMLAKEQCKRSAEMDVLFPSLALLMDQNVLTESIVYTVERACAVAVTDDPGAQRLMSTIRPDMDAAFGRAIEQIALAGRLKAAIEGVA